VKNIAKKTLKQAVRATGLTRRHVGEARLCCERQWLAAFGQRRKRWVGRILCYHSIGQPEFGVNDVSVTSFRRHIELALNAGHRFVPASEIARTGGGPKDLAITFDDGLKSVRTAAAPILKEYDIPWSFFPVTDWCDGKEDWCRDLVLSWGDLEALMYAGAEIGSHSCTHPDFSQLDAQRVVDELGHSRETIRARLGVDPDSFAIPFGQSSNWSDMCASAAREAGYDTIYAQAEATRPNGTIARTFVTKYDGDRIFKALLAGKYDSWEEWV
jgi:peptidoglycan/xylan/chitin deacetylase (PgdA/CDA1 family)